MADTFTRDDLISDVLFNHRRVTEGNPGSPWERARVDEKIDADIEELRQKDVVSLDVNGEMPIEYRNWLAEFVMHSCARAFGVPPDLAARGVAMAQMRLINAQMPTYQPTEIDSLFTTGRGGYGDYVPIKHYRRGDV